MPAHVRQEASDTKSMAGIWDHRIGTYEEAPFSTRIGLEPDPASAIGVAARSRRRNQQLAEKTFLKGCWAAGCSEGCLS